MTREEIAMASAAFSAHKERAHADPTHTLVSEVTQDRLARAEFEMKIAQREWLAAWEAYNREAYIKSEMTDANAED